jgi:hypothetical protein
LTVIKIEKSLLLQGIGSHATQVFSAGGSGVLYTSDGGYEGLNSFTCAVLASSWMIARQGLVRGISMAGPEIRSAKRKPLGRCREEAYGGSKSKINSLVDGDR